jgi:hypothetical protein
LGLIRSLLNQSFRDRLEASSYAGTIGEAIDALIRVARACYAEHCAKQASVSRRRREPGTILRLAGSTTM